MEMIQIESFSTLGQENEALWIPDLVVSAPQMPETSAVNRPPLTSAVVFRPPVLFFMHLALFSDAHHGVCTAISAQSSGDARVADEKPKAPVS